MQSVPGTEIVHGANTALEDINVNGTLPPQPDLTITMMMTMTKDTVMEVGTGEMEDQVADTIQDTNPKVDMVEETVVK